MKYRVTPVLCFYVSDVQHRVLLPMLVLQGGAFPRQKWLRERASVLRFTYICQTQKAQMLTAVIFCQDQASPFWVIVA